MPLFMGQPATHARDVNESTPLPLAQQILAWLIQALGYEHHREGPAKVSSSTLKHARRGRIIRRSWNSLVKETCELLRLSPSAPEVLQEMLREWDGYVSTLRSPPLDVGDRLLPIMGLAVPRLGVRLGAAMALACVVTGKPASDWEWLCDPLAPGVFGRLLRLTLTTNPPTGTSRTRTSAECGKIIRVDPKTIRRWDAGDVPGPQNIAAIVERIGDASEVPLRWARAAMVARTDLEGWVGKKAVDSWREAVRHTALDVGVALATDPRAIPKIAELWSESLAATPTPEMGDPLANVVRLANVQIASGTVESWLRGIATRPAATSAASDRDARAVLFLTIFLPHPQLLAATYTHIDPTQALTFLSADPQVLLSNLWSFRALLRIVEQGGTIWRQREGGPEEAVPVPESARDAARTLLAESGIFIRSTSAVNEGCSEASTLSLLATILGSAAPHDVASMEVADAVWPYALLDRRVEKILPSDVVRVLPKLALARARRLAAAGDVYGAMVLIKTIDLTSYRPDAPEREDLATLLSEIAHWTLDEIYRCLQSGIPEFDPTDMDAGVLRAEALATISRDVAACVETADRLIDAAVRWIDTRPQSALSVEAVVLSFPYHLRRERLLHALGRSAPEDSKFMSLLEALVEYAEHSPSDGGVCAMLAIAQRFAGVGPTWVAGDFDPRCEHLGTAAIRDRWLTRIRSDLASP